MLSLDPVVGSGLDGVSHRWGAAARKVGEGRVKDNWNNRQFCLGSDTVYDVKRYVTGNAIHTGSNMANHTVVGWT